MSANVFPILPLVDPKKSALPEYATRVLQSVSGKQVRASWRASPIVPIRFTVRLRSWVYAPSPWGTYREPDLFWAFWNTHKGGFDSFLIDNTTKLYYPAGPADATSTRVRFARDTPDIEEQYPGLYVANIEWETVL